MILIAILIKVTSKGPVFLQNRIGINGKYFKNYKVSYDDSQLRKKGTGLFSFKDDPRSQNWGNF